MRILFFAVHIRRMLLLASLIVVTALIAGIAAGRTVERPRYLQGWLIAVDAGHGGEDKGAWFPNHGLVEKDVNLDVARNLGRLLAADGANVILIREDDTFVRLGDRANRANSVNARMFVSIHVNRYPGSKACHGAQVFYDAKSPESRRLAELAQEQLLGIDPSNCRTALPGDYKVLRDTAMPSILVEIGFATNPGDRELIMSPHYRRDVIYAIRNSIIAYARSTPESAASPMKIETGGR